VAGREGWDGWDAYAPFYDWENARTLGRRDVPFWRRLAGRARGYVLELGCGTGRVSLPLARAGVRLVGIDRSTSMLERASARAATLPDRRRRRRWPPALIRGDIRSLPFRPAQFAMVLAPYGILQSLLRDRDLKATLRDVARVLPRGGIFGLDLVPDVPKWREYRNRVQLEGPLRGGGRLTLIESVRQQRRRHVTVFEQCYVERHGDRRTEHRFALQFRTLPMRQMISRVEEAGFSIETMLGDYHGRAWDERSDVWIILAARK
jgi:SAM-dependent methyltransferase